MNRDRRKKIEDISGAFERLKSELEEIIAEEQEYFDNMPENLQGGEKGERAENAIGSMEEALTDIENAIDNINAAVE